MRFLLKYGFPALILILAIWAYNIYTTDGSKKETVKTQQEKKPEVKGETVHQSDASNNTAEAAVKKENQATKKASKPETNKSKTNKPKDKVLLDAPLINQEPELDRGCEVTSLAMMLQYDDKDVTKMQLADQIKKVPFRVNGVRSNPNDGFVGNIETFSESGYAVYHKPLADLARRYLPNHTIDMTGKSFDSIIDQLKKGIPVVVITNSTFRPISEAKFTTWHTNSGDVKITYSEHSVLVTGFDKDHIYINNPLGGKNVKTDRKGFIDAWKQMGSQAVSYTK